VLAEAGASVHMVAGEKVPLPSEETLTVPVGTPAVPAPVSATVTAHVVAPATETVDGVHTTVVAVGREATVMAVVELLDPQPGVPAAPA
jgi:hypothetical protein